MKKSPIKYTDRDFDSIKSSLLEHARKYYPNTFRDFNESSFGMFALDTVSYVGDVLSFYLDYQASESFFDSAIEFNNIVRLAREKGYKFTNSQSSFGTLSFYILVPSNLTGAGPNLEYAPILRRLTEVSSNSGENYVLTEDVDFSNTDKIQVAVAKVNEVTGVPTYYAIKATGKAVSGTLTNRTIEVGEFTEFLKLPLGSRNITEIVSVFDIDGNEYYEVPFLAQDVIYKPILNTNNDRDSVINILKPVVVSRRFEVIFENDETYLQFGSGSGLLNQQSKIVDPVNTSLQMTGRPYISDKTFDPSKLLTTDKFGVAPSNTTLFVTYRENNTRSVNASINTITNIVRPIFKFNEPSSLSPSEISYVRSTLEVTNEIPFNGSVTAPTSDEVRMRAKSYFATQNRCVTSEDYKALCYAMPPNFGSIKRVNISQDSNSFKRNLNLYVISENNNGTLVESSSTLKENLKTWIASHKMTNDTIDILDARVVNYGVQFQIIAEPDKNKYEVLERAITRLSSEFLIKSDIGESILISRFYNLLNEVEGVEDVVDVKVFAKFGAGYSNVRFDFDSRTTPDGRTIKGYDNVIFELKNPTEDIKGSIV